MTMEDVILNLEADVKEAFPFYRPFARRRALREVREYAMTLDDSQKASNTLYSLGELITKNKRYSTFSSLLELLEEHPKQACLVAKKAMEIQFYHGKKTAGLFVRLLQGYDSASVEQISGEKIEDSKLKSTYLLLDSKACRKVFNTCKNKLVVMDFIRKIGEHYDLGEKLFSYIQDFPAVDMIMKGAEQMSGICTSMTEKYVSMMQGKSSEEANRVARMSIRIINKAKTTELLEGFMDAVNLLDRYESPILEDFAEYYIGSLTKVFVPGWKERLQKTRDHNLIMEQLLQEEKNFIAQQNPQYLFPILSIMAEFDGGYHPQIKQLDENCKRNLAHAYSIAKNNIDEDTGENYLGDFYQGVQGMLDTRPDDLGRWAKSVCDDFKKQGEAGLLREVSG